MAKLSVAVENKTTFLKQEAIDDIMKASMQAKEGLVGEQSYGLGLKLVRHLVLEMGGQMDINSEEKTGSKFNVSIPRYI